jgi:hypothetical protein
MRPDCSKWPVNADLVGFRDRGERQVEGAVVALVREAEALARNESLDAQPTWILRAQHVSLGYLLYPVHVPVQRVGRTGRLVVPETGTGATETQVGPIPGADEAVNVAVGNRHREPGAFAPVGVVTAFVEQVVFGSDHLRSSSTCVPLPLPATYRRRARAADRLLDEGQNQANRRGHLGKDRQVYSL